MRAPFLDDAVDDARDDAVATMEPCIVNSGNRKEFRVLWKECGASGRKSRTYSYREEVFTKRQAKQAAVALWLGMSCGTVGYVSGFVHA